ncbi:hypothetical protein Tco_0491607 [Tanacetum coccineum]
MALAKLSPCSRLGKNGKSWVAIPITAPETASSTATKMIVPSTAEEKTCKKNDVKARSLLLMALPNEHQLTFDQYVDAQSMFAAIKARFGGNEATKKTQKAMLKQQYENFNASSSESLDSIFNRLQKLLICIPKPNFDTMGLDDLYNNFKIVEQKVKKSVGTNNDDKNLAFLNHFRLLKLELLFSAAIVYLSFQSDSTKDGAGFITSDMAEKKIHANMPLMAFSDSDGKTKIGKKIVLFTANHVREEEPKKARENNDALIIEDWVLDDEDDDEPNSKDEKKSDIPTVTKKEFV